ncbi:MAG: response regulator [Spirochaetaceae bacterium]|nr:MAG: response regulator [Spirochaetaceae bacterium]
MEHKGKILIVDDEQINLDFFDVMLSKLGFVVERAEDGEQALERVREGKPDLVILDNIMPKLSGWEVTRTIKQSPDYAEVSDVPIIMFSAMDDVKDKIEGFELGIEDYITKPFNFSEVLARIKAVLRGRELTRQVLERERRIALIESLNKSLVYFTRHLREPVLEIIRASQKLDRGNQEDIGRFVELVRSEIEATLASLDGLEEEIRDLQTKGDAIKSREVTLDMLEEKYQKHFDQYHKKFQSDGVSH